MDYKRHDVPERDTRVVLCVDPDGEIATSLDDPAFEVISVETLSEARDCLSEHDIDCVVADYEFPDGTAFQLFDEARERHPNVGCVLFTDVGHDEMDLQTVSDTVVEYLPRGGPASDRRLRETVRRIVDDRSQVGFPLPPAEDERLDTLAAYDLPDLETAEAFDRLTALVAEHFGVSVAFIGLLEAETEQFVACHGAEWEELTREDSICTYAILEEDVTVIENVQADPRFAHNDRLKDLGVRAYAGANLTVADGTTIGELCLIDDEPRSFTDAEQADLSLFADEVTEQLEFRRRLGVATLPEAEQ
jgi:GAF domain-containing protein